MTISVLNSKDGKRTTIEKLVKGYSGRKLVGHKARISNSYINFSQDVLPNNECYVQFFYDDNTLYVTINKDNGAYKMSEKKYGIVITSSLRKRLNDNKIPNGLYELKKIEDVEKVSEGDILYKFIMKSNSST